MWARWAALTDWLSMARRRHRRGVRRRASSSVDAEAGAPLAVRFASSESAQAERAQRREPRTAARRRPARPGRG
jgi:hypothetical protein